MRCQDFISIIENTAPLSLATSWDNSGIQIASKKEDLKTICVTLDANFSSIAKAINEKADLILTHHPLSLIPKLPNKLDDFHAILTMILENQTWLYSAHTSLDLNLEGPVSWLAQKLQLTNLKPLEKTPESISFSIEKQKEFGFGYVGLLPKPVPSSVFFTKIAKILNISSWQRIGKIPDLIKKVAILPGSGASAVTKAFENDADIFITGDVKFHQAQQAEHRGLVLDVGHFILEEKMMNFWAQSLQTELENENINIIFIPGTNPYILEQVAL